jgi:quinol monooxygenase YgiN
LKTCHVQDAGVEAGIRDASRRSSERRAVLSCTLFQQLGSNVFLWVEQYQDKDAVAAHDRHVAPANVLGMMRTGRLVWMASA